MSDKTKESPHDDGADHGNHGVPKPLKKRKAIKDLSMVIPSKLQRAKAVINKYKKRAPLGDDDGNRRVIKRNNAITKNKKPKHSAYEEFLNEYDIYDDYGYGQQDAYGYSSDNYGYVGNYDSYQGLQGQNVGLFGNNNYGLMLFLPAILIGLCLLGILFCICGGIGAIMGCGVYNAVNRTLIVGGYKKVARAEENDSDDQRGLLKIQVLFCFFYMSYRSVDTDPLQTKIINICEIFFIPLIRCIWHMFTHKGDYDNLLAGTNITYQDQQYKKNIACAYLEGISL